MAFILLSQLCCAQDLGRVKLNGNEALFRQYAFLLERSMRFDHGNKDFRYEVQQFIDSCTEYSFHQEKRVKPFEGSKLKPVIVPPYLFNTNYDKVILTILTRENDLQNKPVDYIHFILGKRIGSIWSFNLKERHTKSFSYEAGYSLLSDTEIFLRVLRELINAGYMPIDGLNINDAFFKKDW